MDEKTAAAVKYLREMLDGGAFSYVEEPITALITVLEWAEQEGTK